MPTPRHLLAASALLAGAGALWSCSKTPDSQPPPYVRPFYWGTSTAAYQVEGGLHGTDWHQWEYQPDGGEWPDGGYHVANNDHADNGPDQFHRFDSDAALAEQLGTNMVRMSIEWARIEPVEGHYDADAIAHYHQVFASLKAHHQLPMVTLQHFTLPTWIHDVYEPAKGYGGWAGRDSDPLGKGGIVSRFARFAGDMAKGCGARLAGVEIPKYEDTETSFSDLKARLRSRFRHILVDEYQDTNHAQYILVRSEERRVEKECRSRWSPYH